MVSRMSRLMENCELILIEAYLEIEHLVANSLTRNGIFGYQTFSVFDALASQTEIKALKSFEHGIFFVFQ